jgi:hypothetical protein
MKGRNKQREKHLQRLSRAWELIQKHKTQRDALG